MTIGRREFVVIAVTAAATTAAGCATVKGVERMYGLIGKMIAVPGQRDALIAILLEGIRGTPMPGCKSYVVACDPMDANAIWITEVWDNEASHKASLQLPAVRNAIARGRPLIAGFGSQQVTEPVDGFGLAS